MTEKVCRERIVKGQKLQRGGGDIELILRFMGYTDEDVSGGRVNGMGDLYFQVSVRLQTHP